MPNFRHSEAKTVIYRKCYTHESTQESVEWNSVHQNVWRRGHTGGALNDRLGASAYVKDAPATNVKTIGTKETSVRKIFEGPLKADRLFQPLHLPQKIRRGFHGSAN
eukprot:Filipodium_phascolosomae@DN6561_c0_g1_i1.p1